VWIAKSGCHNGTPHIDEDKRSDTLKDIPQSCNDNGDFIEIGCSVDPYTIAHHTSKERANGQANLDTVNVIHGMLNGVVIVLRVSLGRRCHK
jgi:hypothetical protein